MLIGEICVLSEIHASNVNTSEHKWTQVNTSEHKWTQVIF